MDPTEAVNQAAAGPSGREQAVRDVSVHLNAQTGPWKQEMQGAAKATDMVAEALHRVDEAYKAVFKRAGQAGVGIGASMQTMAAGATFAAAQFEEAFARVAKTTGLQNTLFGGTGVGADLAASFGLGDDALQQFENDIRALSTTIPVSVNELAHLADVAGQLGVESKNLELFARTASELGAGISGLSSDVAIQALANLIGAFGLAETEVVNLGSSLAVLANRTRATAPEILEFSQRMQGFAVQIGITADELMGLGAAVSAIAVRPELASTAITNALTKISLALQSGGDQAERFAATMGVTVEELRQMWAEGGPTSVLVKLVTALSTQGDKAQVTLQSLGLTGVGVTTTLGGLAAQLDVLTGSLATSSSEFERGEAVGELAGIVFDTLTKKIQRFRQTTSEVFRSLGQGMLVLLKPMVDMVTEVVNVFNELPQGIKTALGFLTGVGGVVLTVAGSFTILVGTFHVFFLTLQLLVHFLPKAVMALHAMGGAASQAAAHLDALATRLLRTTQAVTATSGAFAAAGAAIRSAFAATGTAALTGLTTALGGVRHAAVALGRFGMHEMLRTWGFAAQMTGKAFLVLGKSIVTMMAPMAIMAVKFAAIIALVQGVQWVWGKMTEGIDEITGSMTAAAEAADLMYESMEKLESLKIAEESTGLALAVEANQLLETVRELGKEAGKDYLIRYGMQLIAQGNSPEQVRRHIEELGELANTPVEFTLDMGAIRGEQFAATIDQAKKSMRDFVDTVPDADYWARNWGMTGPFGMMFASTKRFREELDDTFNLMKTVAAGDPVTGLAVYTAAFGHLQQGLIEGKLSIAEYTDALKQLNDQAFVPIPDVGMLKYAELGDVVAHFLSQDWQNVEGFEDIRKVVHDLVGETDDYKAAIDNLSPQQVQQLADAFANLSVEQVKALQKASIQAFGTELGRQMSIPIAMDLDDTQTGRFMDQLRQSFPQQVGFVEAIKQARKELAGMEDQWGDQADRLRTMIDEWSQKLVEIQVPNLVEELRAGEAGNEVRTLGRLLQELALPHDIAVTIRTSVLQQTFQQETQDFRQVMGQYDSLLKQRENTIENHNQRLADMEEDRVKSLQDAREDYAKNLRKLNEDEVEALRDLNEKEKEAHEERAEQFEDAFNALERIQAKPSAGIGAMLHNIEAQNRAMAEMASTVSELERMGLSADVAQHLGFDDPRNFAQARRLLETALSDPSMISKVNQAWAQRLDISEGFAKATDEAGFSEIAEDFDEQRKEIKERFAEQRKDMAEGLDEQIASINERHSRAVEDANKNHQRQLRNIADQLKELGRTTFETLDDLLDKAASSGLKKLEEWASHIKGLRTQMALLQEPIAQRQAPDVTRQKLIDIEGGTQNITPVVQYDRLREDGAEKAAERAGLVFKDEFGLQVSFAMDEATRTMDTGSQEAMDRVKGNVKSGVSEALTYLEQLASFDLGRFALDIDVGGTSLTNSISNAIVAGFDKAADRIDSRVKDGYYYPPGGGRIPLNRGGEVPGSGNTDSVPAMLTPGEFVIPKEAVQRYGVKTFEGYRAQKYNTGGLVGGVGREPVTTDIVGALTRALEKGSVAGGETNNYGPIQVEAADVNDMLRQLETKRRLSRLTTGGGRGLGS